MDDSSVTVCLDHSSDSVMYSWSISSGSRNVSGCGSRGTLSGFSNSDFSGYMAYYVKYGGNGGSAANGVGGTGYESVCDK